MIVGIFTLIGFLILAAAVRDAGYRIAHAIHRRSMATATENKKTVA